MHQIDVKRRVLEMTNMTSSVYMILLFITTYLLVGLSQQCGEMECVPDSQSRDQLGKQTLVSLKEYFHSVYGDEESVSFQDVRFELCCSSTSSY